MDLSRANQVGFYQDYFNGLYKPEYPDYNGDQGLYNIYFHQYPERVQLMDCSWNFRFFMLECSGDPAIRCEAAEADGIHLMHATAEALFKDSVLMPVYDCMETIDFSRISASLKCLKHAEIWFHKKTKKCSSHFGMLKTLKQLFDQHEKFG